MNGGPRMSSSCISLISKFSVFCLGWKVAEKALQFRLPIVKWVVARAGGRWSEDDEEFTV